MILIFISFEKLLNMGMKSDNLIKKDCLKLLNLQQSIKTLKQFICLPILRPLLCS